MDHLFDRLGVSRLVNAAGTLTRLSGTVMDAEVTAAMAEAGGRLVRIDELQAAAGRRLADYTGAEAAIVTAGASAALTLSAAACIAGLDAARMDRLPDTTGLPCEIIVPRSHRNGYDHALRLAGARLVEVGIAERTRDPQPWEIAAAITPQTVAVAYSVGFSPLELVPVVRVAHEHRLPVIVDAAAALPPRANLRAFVSAGADLVCYSGGKAIRGPQATGILCGRRELIASAALQMWDLDVLPALWSPPAALVDADVALRGVPNHGIGRGMKVGKEQIAGLLVALARFLAQDEAAENARLGALAEQLADGLQQLPGTRVSTLAPPGHWKLVSLEFEAATDVSAIEFCRRLEHHAPPIYVGQGDAEQGRVLLDPFCLQPGDAETLVAAIRGALGK
ncbi:MAG: aminotransferase class V-fold PLP-dependent enzyme [Pirellulales bacterium]|nr:aminotransferase class V-fold PLP-dependent enzyme [Pirellulales bacterium]